MFLLPKFPVPELFQLDDTSSASPAAPHSLGSWQSLNVRTSALFMGRMSAIAVPCAAASTTLLNSPWPTASTRLPAYRRDGEAFVGWNGASCDAAPVSFAKQRFGHHRQLERTVDDACRGLRPFQRAA